jgi:hypothetical protein
LVIQTRPPVGWPFSFYPHVSDEKGLISLSD